MALWAVAITAGMAVFHRHMTTPGEASAAPVALEASEAPTIYFFAHPHCGCTTTTIPLLAQRASQIDANIVVVFTGSAANTPDWTESPNAQKARAFEQLTTQHDPNGTLAHRFGARTSGHTVVYDHTGARRFSGGLTSARGMIGPSAGWDAIDAVLNGTTPHTESAPVFGCRLFDENDFASMPGADT